MITGCSGSSSPAPSGSDRITTTASARPNGGASTSATGTESGRDRVYHGTITGTPVTCVVFVGQDGTQYALSGTGVGDRVHQIASSGHSRKSLRGSPSPRQKATVTVVGHVEPHAMNTCGLRTLVASTVTITSVRALTGSPPRIGT